MFGGRPSSASYGQGIAGFPSRSSVPLPSGGYNLQGRPSVNNKSMDLQVNDVPSTLIMPSTHAAINMADQPLNDLRLNDFVFCIRKTGYGPDYRSRFGKFGERETPIVSMQMANSLLRQMAEEYGQQTAVQRGSEWKDGTGEGETLWWQCPDMVASGH